jgi:hypothetical protein
VLPVAANGTSVWDCSQHAGSYLSFTLCFCVALGAERIGSFTQIVKIVQVVKAVEIVETVEIVEIVQ